MKQKYSSAWKSSSQIRKQRKYIRNAPLHIRQEFVSCNLSKELRQKHSKRHVALRKGDTIIIKKGQFKGKSGKVEQVLLKKGIVYVSGIEVVKKNGSKVKYPLKPCNLQITSLVLDDKKRLLQFEKAKAKGSIKEKPKKELKEKVSRQTKQSNATKGTIKPKNEQKVQTEMSDTKETKKTKGVKELTVAKSGTSKHSTLENKANSRENLSNDNHKVKDDSKEGSKGEKSKSNQVSQLEK